MSNTRLFLPSFNIIAPHLTHSWHHSAVITRSTQNPGAPLVHGHSSPRLDRAFSQWLDKAAGPWLDDAASQRCHQHHSASNLIGGPQESVAGPG